MNLAYTGVMCDWLERAVLQWSFLHPDQAVLLCSDHEEGVTWVAFGEKADEESSFPGWCQR
ncbi:MAG: hypothetical protein A2Y91_02680 [Chloroflexi bacterium RBG_13_54_8]|nr:MAG: hypothetical protein A2Y91_02680 [Chloroflexi bacterium RBG_13_54_8]